MRDLSFIPSSAKGNTTLQFERVDFRDPFLIVYSSGTTGMPKCVVHSGGAVLMNRQKEGNLHRDVTAIDPDDLCTLQFTTTGWIMYMVVACRLAPVAERFSTMARRSNQISRASSNYGVTKGL